MPSPFPSASPLTLTAYKTPFGGTRYRTSRSGDNEPLTYTRSGKTREAFRTGAHVAQLTSLETTLVSVALNEAASAFTGAVVATPLTMIATLELARSLIHQLRAVQPGAERALRQQVERLEESLRRAGFDRDSNEPLSDDQRFEMERLHERVRELHAANADLLALTFSTVGAASYSGSLAVTAAATGAQLASAPAHVVSALATAGGAVAIPGQIIGAIVAAVNAVRGGAEIKSHMSDREALRQLANLPDDVREQTIATINRNLARSGVNVGINVIRFGGQVFLLAGNLLVLTVGAAPAAPVFMMTGASLVVTAEGWNLFNAGYRFKADGRGAKVPTTLPPDDELARLIRDHGLDVAMKVLAESRRSSHQTIVTTKMASLALRVLDDERPPVGETPEEAETRRHDHLMSLADKHRGNKSMFTRSTLQGFVRDDVTNACAELKGTGMLSGSADDVRLRLLARLELDPLFLHVQAAPGMADTVVQRTATSLRKTGDPRIRSAIGRPPGVASRDISEREYLSLHQQSQEVQRVELEEALPILVHETKEGAKRNCRYIDNQLALIARTQRALKPQLEPGNLSVSSQRSPIHDPPDASAFESNPIQTTAF